MRRAHSTIASRRAILALAALAAFCAIGIAGARMLWRAPFESIVPTSVVVTDANGKLLRLTLSSDDKYRLWTPLARMPPELVEAVVLKEDRWFRWHPGVNPFALVRGALRTYAEGERQGGSTLTMQLARILRASRHAHASPARSRQVGARARGSRRAIRSTRSSRRT